jgi:C1A family cysteine protease
MEIITDSDALAEAQKFIDSSVEDMSESDLPETWDWRDVMGYDFTSPHRNQGSCGSCYTVSFITAMESRIRIKTGKSY